MNSRNSKASDLHRLLVNLLHKINLKTKNKYVALSNLSIKYIWKNIKNEINLEYQLWHGMKSLSYPIDYILHQIFKSLLRISTKNVRQLLIILQ